MRSSTLVTVLALAASFLTGSFASAASNSDVTPILTCQSAHGSVFIGILVRGAHYDSICNVVVKKGDDGFAPYDGSECPGALYGIQPNYVLGMDLEDQGSVEVKPNEKGVLTYTDSAGSSEAKCDIENDFIVE
ncbi:MAG TPA: hypothetical protein VM432_03600 [Bdellovibrionales bacterium]|nr:hypothetical protein [Bdellovibrionales bacterium]